MAKHIDISAKITLERPTVTFCGKTYEVNNGKNNMLLLQQYMSEEHGDIEMLFRAIDTLLGKKASEEIDKLDLPLDALETVYLAVMAAASGEDYEEAEARFRKTNQ